MSPRPVCSASVESQGLSKEYGVRQRVGPGRGVEGSTWTEGLWEAPVWRNKAGPPLLPRRDPDTIAGVSTVCLSVRSSAGSAHTGKAFHHCEHACVSPDGTSEWTSCHTCHKQTASLLTEIKSLYWSTPTSSFSQHATTHNIDTDPETVSDMKESKLIVKS